MANYIGKETQITVGQKTYKLARLTRGIMHEFAEWAKSQIPNPLNVVAEKLPLFDKYPHLQDMMVKQAVKDSKTYGDVNSHEVQAIAGSMDGQIKMVTLLLKANHPEVTEDEAFEIAMQFSREEKDRKINAQAKKLKQEQPELSEEDALQMAQEQIEEEDEDSFRKYLAQGGR